MPSPALVPASAVAAPNTPAPGTPANVASANAEAASDLVASSPFATMLQEQLAAQILMPATEFVGLPVMQAADAPAEDVLTATLPGLIAMIDAQALAASVAESDAGASGDDGRSISDIVPLALPNVSGQPVQATPTVADTGLTTTDASAGTRNLSAADTAVDPAILAANSDTAKRGDTQGAGKGEASFATAVEQAAAHRADAAAQAHATRASEQPQRIEAPVGSRQWDGEFANRLAWMVGRQEQRADLVLTPPALGRIEVSLSVSGDQATAIFTSASATVRDAIENALPRLREVLLESGITLGQTQVGSESPQQSPARGENADNRGNALAGGRDSGALPPGLAVNAPAAWVASGRGLIDVFA